MTDFFKKFKNAEFPNWLRQVKAERSYIQELPAANDNERVPFVSEAKDISSFYLSNPCYLTVINLQKEFLRKHPKIVKLKLPASVKRRLRKDKKNYQKVREWLDGAEKIINESLFGADADER